MPSASFVSQKKFLTSNIIPPIIHTLAALKGVLQIGVPGAWIAPIVCPVLLPCCYSPCFMLSHCCVASGLVWMLVSVPQHILTHYVLTIRENHRGDDVFTAYAASSTARRPRTCYFISVREHQRGAVVGVVSTARP